MIGGIEKEFCPYLCFFHCKNNLTKGWMAECNKFKKTELSEEVLILVKFTVSTNSWLNQLKNPELVNCLKIDAFDHETFSKVIVPNVLKELYKVLNEMLVDADNKTLISDIWSGRTLFFMGVAVSTINDNFDREI